MQGLKTLLVLSLVAFALSEEWTRTANGIPAEGLFLQTGWAKNASQFLPSKSLITVTSAVNDKLRIYCGGKGLTLITPTFISENECLSVYISYRGDANTDATNEKVTLTSTEPPHVKMSYNVPIKITTPSVLTWDLPEKGVNTRDVNITILTPDGSRVVPWIWQSEMIANELGVYTLGNQTIHRIDEPFELGRFKKSATNSYEMDGKVSSKPRIQVRTDRFLLKHAETGEYKVGDPRDFNPSWGDFLEYFWPNMPLGHYMILGIPLDNEGTYTSRIGTTSGPYFTLCQENKEMNVTWAWVSTVSTPVEFKCVELAGLTEMNAICSSIGYSYLVSCHNKDSFTINAKQIMPRAAVVGGDGTKNTYESGRITLFNVTIAKNRLLYLPLDSFTDAKNEISISDDTYMTDRKASDNILVVVDGRSKPKGKYPAQFISTKFIRVNGKYSVKIPARGVTALDIYPPDNETCLLLFANKKDYKIDYIYKGEGVLNARWISDDQFVVCSVTRVSIRSVQSMVKAEIKIERVPLIDLNYNEATNLFHNSTLAILRFRSVPTNRVVTVATTPNNALGWSNGNSHNGHIDGSRSGRRFNFCQSTSYIIVNGHKAKVVTSVAVNTFYSLSCDKE